MPLLDSEGNEVVAHVPLEQFRIMQHDLMFLTCLRACGVDNWDGFDDAIEMHKKMKKELEDAGKDGRRDNAGTSGNGNSEGQSKILLPD